MLQVLQALDQLPDSLVIEVLALTSADLNQQLSILPDRFHHLAVEAAFPSIRRQRSLTLAIHSSKTAYAVLNAAITASSALKSLHLSDIPLQANKQLHPLIAVACSSASDVSLSFHDDNLPPESNHMPLAQVHEALCCNTALTSLSLTFRNDSGPVLNLDCLVKALTSLQSLTLARSSKRRSGSSGSEHAPRCITNLLCLTHLCVGPGFRLMNLSEIMCSMTQLQALHLRDDWEPMPQELPSLNPLTALQTLELHCCLKLEVLPPLDHVTALKTLMLSDLRSLRIVPSLATLTKLQTLKVSCCTQLIEFPLLDSLTALQTLELIDFGLPEIPPLASLSALQTLEVSDCKDLPSLAAMPELQSLQLTYCLTSAEFPILDSLTGLRTLELTDCERLQQIAPVANLTALQTLKLIRCLQLRVLPPLARLTALQNLDLNGCARLRELPPLYTLTALETLLLRNCWQLQPITLVDTLTALRTLDVNYSPRLLNMVAPSTLPALKILNSDPGNRKFFP
jgi:Leucine-rich repeat (LRR) protein